MDARLKSTNQFGIELRFAAKKSDTWPSYHARAPLGKRGYWYGEEKSHSYLGISPDPSELELYGFKI